MHAPDEVARQAGADDRVVPSSVYVDLALVRHTEFLHDHGLVRALLRGRVVGDPLTAPDCAAWVRLLAPALRIELRDGYISNSTYLRKARGAYMESSEVDGADVQVDIEVDAFGTPTGCRLAWIKIPQHSMPNW